MRTTIDGAGRVIVPKAFRDRLGLGGGTEVEILLQDGAVRIEPAPTPMRIEGEGRDVYAVPDREMPALTATQVRDALEQTRR